MKLTLLTALLLTPLAAMQAADAPRPSPVSLVMLSGPWLPENPHQLDFASLPKVPSEHAVVSDVRDLRSTETVARPNTLPPLLKYGGCNNHSYRAISTDDGRTWSQPVKTNFPDATSKVSGLRLSDGRYLLVSNPDPKKRDPLTLAIGDDGLVFTTMLCLVGGRRTEYPHVVEHEGSLFIAFSGGKMSVEVLKVKLSDVDAVKMPDMPLIGATKP